MTQIKAIIFDLDGVLLPTNIFHREALVEAIKGVTGIDTNGTLLVSEHSMLSSKMKIKNVQEFYKFSENLCSLILSNKDNIFFSKLANTTPANNVIECLDTVRSMGIKTAIASNSRFNNMERVLEMTNLRKYFDAIVSAEEVNFPKPEPDVLFRAYSKLGLLVNEYSETIFVDDTEEGAAAGHSSPSTVVKINSPDDLSIELFKEWL